jgi:predicted PurR-regulated permease PerM
MTLSSSTTAQDRARARWAALGDRLRTVTPEAVGRGVLTLAVVAVAVWGVVSSWPALAPFLAGAVIAYAVLPVANRLDRFMPRVLAALLAELLALAILVGVLIVVVPPVLASISRAVGQLPTPDRIEAALTNLQSQLGELPEPVRSIVLAVATQTLANLQAVVEGAVDGIAAFVTTQILHIAGTVSFLLGLLVIPAWVLTVVADENGIRQRTANLIAPAIRADVVAIVRIVDRAFGTFLRIRVLLAIVAGMFMLIGFEAAAALGISAGTYAVGAATLLGVLQLIPELGYFLGFFPLLLVLAIGGPVAFVAAIVTYVVSVRLASGLVETRVSRGVLDVHPALLIPAIVVLSQFGPLWLLVAAPFIAIFRDIVRYLAGRLAEPPQPAGVLPGDRRATAAAEAAALTPLPSVYRNPAETRAAASGPVRDSSTRLVGAAIPRLDIAPFTAAPPAADAPAVPRAAAAPIASATERSPIL